MIQTLARIGVTVVVAILVELMSAGAGVRGQERIVSPNANVPYLGVHGTFTVDQAELAARDPRNPKRVIFERMERFSFYEDLQGRVPIARDCIYAHEGPAGDPYYYPARSKASIWELFKLLSGEAACRKYTYVALRAPHGNPVHMHMRYGDERTGFEALLAMSDGPEDKTKLDPWWSVYCAEGRSGCDK
jgi:hypothetical protein